jgi:hypothetical protein
VRHIVVVLSLLCLLSPMSAQGASSFTLTCRIQLGYRGPVDKNVYVDTLASTVNGVPAEITDGQIAWTEHSGDYHYEHFLNRYTGSLSISGKDPKSGAVANYTGDCVLATQKKF